MTKPKQAPAVKQPYRSRLGATGLFLLAALLACFAVYWSVDAFNQLSEDSNQTDNFELAFAMFALAGTVFYLARQAWAPSAEQLLAHDPRRPVIYLRPFDEDFRRASPYPIGKRIGGIALEGDSAAASHEESIVHALRQIGPVVAVGAPGDSFAPLGAARLYLADDEWQPKVEALVRGAAAVILVPETSQGTRWEVTEVAQLVDPRRVLIIVPNPALRPLGYARIRNLTEETLPVALPADCGSVNAFLFDSAWRPSPIVFGRRPGKALEPFVEQLRGLTAAKPAPT